MNKLFKRLILALLLVNAAIWSIPAHSVPIGNLDALALTSADGWNIDTNYWTGADATTNPSNLSETVIATIVGAVDPLFSLYKSDFGGDHVTTDSGPHASSYDTLFNESFLDPNDAVISLTLGGDAIVCGTCYLYVKDGNHDPYWYVFNISGWNGETLDLDNFWAAGGGAISHIEILGTTANVPEPAISALLGIGLLGMIGVSRRRKV